MCPIADEQVAIDVDAVSAQGIHFFHQGEGVEHDSVADDAAASLAQDAAGDQLQDELLALDGDRVAGIMAAGVARYDTKALRENVNDLAFALVAPLCSDDDGRLAWFQLAAPRQWRVSRLASTRIRTQLAGDLR